MHTGYIYIHSETRCKCVYTYIYYMGTLFNNTEDRACDRPRTYVGRNRVEIYCVCIIICKRLLCTDIGTICAESEFILFCRGMPVAVCQGTLRLNHHRPSIYFCIQGGHGRFSEFTIKSHLLFI